MGWFRRKRSAVDLDEVDAIISANVKLAKRLHPDDRAYLTELTAQLMETKRWEPIAPLVLSTEITATIAANAAIPILGLDPSIYSGVKSIIVRSSAVISHGLRGGSAEGTYSDGPSHTIGEAHPYHGPLSISWDAALDNSKHPATGHNVVIHEFAHKIDMSDGETDGSPPLRGAALQSWDDLLDDEFERPAGRDSDSVLDPYAWTNAAEFFAVSTEVFFCRPQALLDAKPRLYEQLAAIYNQDPAG